MALVGPRQAGKTTLAKSLGSAYYDLEQEPDRLRLDLEWGRVEESHSLVVLDEAQAHPAAFPRLRGAIDRNRKRNGRFLLLGSVSPALMHQVSESLAGRLAICELPPFLLPEIRKTVLDRLWLCGGFPDGGVLRRGGYPDWQNHYLQLLVQRDLPHWGLPAKPELTLRFLKMVAASHGNVWNASEISRSLGLNYHTVNTYLGFLEGAFLVRRLPAYSGNLRKRLIRNPKIYWRDSGLLHALLGGPDREGLLSRPWVGASWEGFVIEQILGALALRGRSADASFLRTNDGYEVDLVLELSGRRWAIEVKLTTSPGPADFERLAKGADLIRADRRVLVSRTSEPVGSSAGISTNLAGLLKLLDKKK